MKLMHRLFETDEANELVLAEEMNFSWTCDGSFYNYTCILTVSLWIAILCENSPGPVNCCVTDINVKNEVYKRQLQVT